MDEDKMVSPRHSDTASIIHEELVTPHIPREKRSLVGMTIPAYEPPDCSHCKSPVDQRDKKVKQKHVHSNLCTKCFPEHNIIMMRLHKLRIMVSLDEVIDVVNRCKEFKHPS